MGVYLQVPAGDLKNMQNNRQETESQLLLPLKLVCARLSQLMESLHASLSGDTARKPLIKTSPFSRSDGFSSGQVWNPVREREARGEVRRRGERKR